ncbi:MAG: hypothetical protein JXQ90_07410 [Cyclobacteriaceae bacterium]
MPKIRINSIHCNTPDEVDKDEIYLKNDGKKIWPNGDLYHRVDTSDTVDVGVELNLNSDWAEIELWDFDYMSLNDKLGVFKMKVDGFSGKYTVSLQEVSEKSTASYFMNWEILED